MLSNSHLHFTIIHSIIEKGYAPSVDELCHLFNASKQTVVRALYNLQEYHGVVLHPNEPKIWAIHPFSLAPTNFYVESKQGAWWGNCAWCSLGIAALIKDDVKISTSLGAQSEQIEINIVDNEVMEKSYLIHFPIPMKKAWDNVIYTCSNMLVFKNEEEVDKWTIHHNIPKGDVQLIENIWNMSRKWYGNHLDPNWKKWTILEAQQIFNDFHLHHEIWQLGDSEDTF